MDLKETLSINSINFEVRRSIRRKRISVGLDTTAGAFYIAAPTRLSAGEISRTLLPQIDGLIKRIKKSENRIIPPHRYENGEKFFYKSSTYIEKKFDFKELEIAGVVQWQNFCFPSK